MTIYPSTQVTLYSGIPFSVNYEHSMYFDSLAQQRAFFSNYTNKHVFDNYMYLRDEGILKVQPETGMRSMWNYNYLSFINPDGMTFYAFIVDVDYINNNTYAIRFSIDFFQTFFFTLTFNPCFVDREHVANDSKGAHTEPEPFNGYGQMIYQCVMSPWVGDPNVPEYPEEIENFNGAHQWVVFATTFNMRDLEEKLGFSPSFNFSPGMKNSIYQGIYYSGFDPSVITNVQFKQLFDTIVEANNVDGVISVFMCPSGVLVSAITGAQRGVDFTIDVDNSNLGAYTPRNNKLYTYPYNYLYITNNEGNAQNYKFEYFDAYEQVYGRIFLSMTSQLSCHPILGLLPRNYCGSLYNYNEILTTSSFPQCAWDSDTFKAFIAQNTGKILASAVNLGIDVIQGGISIGAGALSMGSSTESFMSDAGTYGKSVTSGGGTGMLLGGVNSLVNTMQQTLNTVANMWDISTLPPQAHGNDTSTLTSSMRVKGFEIYRVHVNSEVARIMDNFFDLYGYHVGIVKVPELHSRQNWNYVKTSGCNLVGAAPASVLSILNQIFNTGITLWHNLNNYGNYLATNTIIGE